MSNSRYSTCRCRPSSIIELSPPPGQGQRGGFFFFFLFFYQMVWFWIERLDSVRACATGNTEYVAAYKGDECLFYQEEAQPGSTPFDEDVTCRGSAWAGNVALKVPLPPP